MYFIVILETLKYVKVRWKKCKIQTQTVTSAVFNITTTTVFDKKSANFQVNFC